MTDNRSSPEIASAVERLENERNVLDNSFGCGAFKDGLTRQRIEAIDSKLAALRASQPAAPTGGEDVDDDDPSSDYRWNAGVDFAMAHFCKVLGVDPKSVAWDAATETVDGDVMAVIGNILRAKYGEDFDPSAVTPTAIPRSSAGNAQPTWWREMSDKEPDHGQYINSAAQPVLVQSAVTRRIDQETQEFIKDLESAAQLPAGNASDLQATYNDLLALQGQTDQVPLTMALDAVGDALRTLDAAATPTQRGNRFCAHDDCPYPDCLVDDGICPSQPPDRADVQRAADYLFEETTKLDAPISYTACLVLVKHILDAAQAAPELEVVRQRMKRLKETECRHSGQMDETLLYGLHGAVKRYLDALALPSTQDQTS